MFRLSHYSIEDIMNFPLPSKTEQKRLVYRPTQADVSHVYEELNRTVFRNELIVPKIHLKSHRQKYWGMCIGNTTVDTRGTMCEIELMDKFFCPQWMVTTLAHEMVHQYQWDIIGPTRSKKGYDYLMSHGPSFFLFREKLEKHLIPLRKAHSMRRWFLHQDIFKC